MTRNGQTLVLHPTIKMDITQMHEVMTLRHFLEKSEVAPLSPKNSMDILSHDEIDRNREDDMTDAHFTMTARKAAEVNEGVLVDPKVP